MAPASPKTHRIPSQSHLPATAHARKFDLVAGRSSKSRRLSCRRKTSQSLESQSKGKSWRKIAFMIGRGIFRTMFILVMSMVSEVKIFESLANFNLCFFIVLVPLHVLHTRWNSDVESSDSEENQLYKPTMPSRYTSNYPGSSKMSFNPKMRWVFTIKQVETFETNFLYLRFSRPSFSYIEQNDDPKLSTLKEFARISGIKINYSRLFDTVRSTDDKCMLIRRILAQKGLQGEPTIAKCKQLRLDLQAKRESAELDKSLIIRTEGEFYHSCALTIFSLDFFCNSIKCFLI